MRRGCSPVYASINRPLTIGGADRRLFFVALVVGGATFTLFGSLLGGLLMFLALYRRSPVGHAARPAAPAHRPAVGHARATVRPRQGLVRDGAAECAPMTRVASITRDYRDAGAMSDARSRSTGLSMTPCF